MINDLPGVYNRFFSNSNSSNSITPDNSKYISHIYNLLDKKVDVSAGESLNSLIEKVKQVEGNIPETTIYITENNTETGYDVTNYTKAIVDVQASAVENDLDKLLNNTIKSCVIPQSIN